MCDAWINDWRLYVRQRIGPHDPKTVEENTQISASTIRRWLNDEKFSQPSVKTAAKFTRGYDPGRLADALIAAGHIRAEDVGAEESEKPLQLNEVADADLIQELNDCVQELGGRLVELRSLKGDEPKRWSTVRWVAKKPGVRRVKNSNERRQL